MEQNKQRNIDPHEFARTFESQIKRVVSEKFSVPEDELELLLEDENGVYMSQEETDTLCCFVIGQNNGFMYLVTGKINEDKQTLTDLKTDILS